MPVLFSFLCPFLPVLFSFSFSFSFSLSITSASSKPTAKKQSPAPYGSIDTNEGTLGGRSHFVTSLQKQTLQCSCNPFPNSFPHDRIEAVVGIEDEINKELKNDI